MRANLAHTSSRVRVNSKDLSGTPASRSPLGKEALGIASFFRSPNRLQTMLAAIQCQLPISSGDILLAFFGVPGKFYPLKKEEHMKGTRREFISTLILQFGAVGIIVAVPHPASACLVGKWRVICPNRHIDMVDDITCNHNCETCGAVAFSNGEGDIVCPNNHPNHVVTGSRDDRDHWLQSRKCSQCGAECRVPVNSPHSHRDPPDHR